MKQLPITSLPAALASVALLAAATVPSAAWASTPYVSASAADSVYLFSYATTKKSGENGLHFAWSRDRRTWFEIGPEYPFVKSDYGNWGPQKKMQHPSLRRQEDGSWTAVWEVNPKEVMVAYTTTSDLVHWRPQDYYPKHIADYFTQPKDTIALPAAGGTVEGEVHRVEWAVVQGLLDECERARRQASLDGERVTDDARRFPKLEPQAVTLRLQPDASKPISDKLIGIFFEDINYAADGGLYAELVQNRDFEYQPRDFRYRRPEWNATYAWSVDSTGLTWTIDTVAPLHANNPHYARLQVSTPGGALINSGYEGIPLKGRKQYRFSLRAHTLGAQRGSLQVSLESPAGETLAQATVKVPAGQEWQTLTATLRTTADCDSARLVLRPLAAGDYALDLISLFPADTYKQRPNGLRADLAQTLADLHPRFVRFPGGCVAHGDGLDNLYRWKNTIGPLEARVPNWNIWKYHQSVGLGYYEYFQFCEDIGAEPLPVMAAAVPCQNSCVGGYGQQGGLPMGEMEAYIQDICDLIEWANGDPKTSSWAKKRAEAGHPKPFNLHYVGIGNEDLISQVFEERFTMIFNALRERHPEITVVGTVGPSSDGSDYEEGWRLARELGVPMVDEHYYRAPGWFLHHQDYYDRYARGGTQVYLGEYAAHVPNRSNCLETALAEAMHLCNVERNGDVVAMTSYAPLLAKRGHVQWNPDLIYFTNTEVQPTTGYYVQALFGQNAGDRYVPASVDWGKQTDGRVHERLASSVVQDSATGALIVKVVNMLPVENAVTVEIPTSAMPGSAKQKSGSQPTVKAQVLTGALNDTRLTPQELPATWVGEGQLKLPMPAYSLAVVRIN
jgi:alpha-L-arabinofuranosidase